MINIELTEHERDLIRLWIENVQMEGQHWGDGMAVFPDEKMVIDKLDRPGGLRFTRFHLELVLDWAKSTHGNAAFTVDELNLLDKIGKALAESK